MLILAAGAQMARPHLTPQSFAAALHSADNNYNNPAEFFCYVNLGERYEGDAFPSEDHFQQGRCR